MSLLLLFPSATPVAIDDVILFGTAPTVGDLLLLSQATFVGTDTQTQTSAKVLTGFPPTVEANNPTLITPGTLAVTGFAPSLEISQTLEIATKAVALTGHAPVHSGTTAFEGIPLASALITTPRVVTPVLSSTMVPAVTASTLNENAPTVVVASAPAASLGVLSMTGRQPVITASAAQTIPVVSMAVSSHAPSVFAGTDLVIDIDYDIRGSFGQSETIVGGWIAGVPLAVTGSAAIMNHIAGSTVGVQTVRGSMTAESLP